MLYHFPVPPSQFLIRFEQCFCGTGAEFADAVESDECGLTYPSLCTGDATLACGGADAVSVYEITGDLAPAPTPVVTPETTYSLSGCFPDSKNNRIMENKMSKNAMSAKVRFCDIFVFFCSRDVRCLWL